MRTSDKRLAVVSNLIDWNPKLKVAEIGSGDGKAMIKIAEKGLAIDGYEINPFLVIIAKWKIKQAGLTNLANVSWKNLWQVNYSKYDLVYVYGISRIMEDLGNKLEQELKPGAQVISVGFKIPNWQILDEEEQVYLYQK